MRRLALLAVVLFACSSSWTGGIHAVLRWRPSTQSLSVERLPEDGTSARAGLRAGDEIRAIDGVPVSSLEEREVRERLRGEVGSRVRLTVRRDGTDREIAIERAPYRTPPVER